MNRESISKEVESIFTLVEIPLQLDLVPQPPRFIESREIQNDMEEFRGQPLAGRAIRTIHRYLPVLSAKATRWILPHYLRFCLTDEAQGGSRMEIASLVRTLSPEPQFREDTLVRFSLLTAAQIRCLIHFLEWCLDDEYWDEPFHERIATGIEFLNTIISAR